MIVDMHIEELKKGIKLPSGFQKFQNKVPIGEISRLKQKISGIAKTQLRENAMKKLHDPHKSISFYRRTISAEGQKKAIIRTSSSVQNAGFWPLLAL